MSAPRAALIWCPFPDAAQAEAAARVLVSEKLAACANLLPGIRSIFAWQGGIETADETVLLVKTEAGTLQIATDRLAALHPYDMPAITGWVADSAAPQTLDWLAASLSGRAC